MWELLDCMYDILRIGCIAGAVFHEWILPRHPHLQVNLQDDIKTTPDYAHRGQKRAFRGRRVYLGMRQSRRGPLSEEETLTTPLGYLPRIPKL